MKRIISFIFCLMLIFVMLLPLAGCTEAERATQNVQLQADYFNVERRLSVINMRSDKPVFELIGYFSISNNSYNELQVTCEVAPGKYKVNYVYLNEWTMYVVEDISGADVTPYKYEVNFLPEMIIPFSFISED